MWDSSDNIISNNTCSYNYYNGIYLYDSSDNNILYLNIFIANNENAADDGVDNQWDNGSIGNYWDDYGGEDANNDGIGDTPYSIGGFAGDQDNYPIWWDVVAISINSPNSNDFFGTTAPSFTISIDKGLAHTTWYTIDNGLINFIFMGTTGTVDQIEWNKISDGLVTLTFYANNTLGAINSSQVIIVKDINIPTIGIFYPESNDLFGITAPSFNVEIYDANLDSMWYTLDNGLMNTTFTTNGTISQTLWDTVSNGTATWTFYANDSAGNGVFSSVMIRVDKNIPTMVINSPNSNELFETSAPSFNVEIYDANLDLMWYTLDNGLTNTTFTTNGTINQALWDALPEGNIVLRFYANDSAGNIGFTEVTIRKDVSAPIITINNPQNSDVIGATAPNFDISIDELNLDKTWYSLNGGNNVTFTGLTGTINQALWDALSEGNVVLRFYANDSTGNIGFTEVTIRKDVTAPTININSPTLNELFGTSAPSFNVEIYDANLDLMWYTLDNGLTNTTFTTNGTINQALWDALPEGNIVLRFYANDSAGNIGFTEVTIRKDVSAPIITINNPQNSDVIGATAPNFDISIDELNLDKTWYSLNGGNNVTFTGLTGTINQALWDALSDGLVIIDFYANDTAGNIGWSSVAIEKDTPTSSPAGGIPGYNILLLLGIVSTIAVIIVKKKLNHLNS